jgi:hypothetical protein
VTHFVQQQASYEQGSYGEAKPPPEKREANEDAKGKQKPPCGV